MSTDIESRLLEIIVEGSDTVEGLLALGNLELLRDVVLLSQQLRGHSQCCARGCLSTS